MRFARSLQVVLLIGMASGAAAQDTAIPDFPGSRPLDVPPLVEPDPAAPGAIVELPSPSREPTDDSAIPKVFVRSIEIRGNTVLPESLLAETARGFVDRALDGNDLETLRTAISQHYRDAGYIGSGAVLPDQDFAGGQLRVVVVEARLRRIELHGQRSYRAGYLRTRIAGKPGAVLNIAALEGRLQRLRREPHIQALHAELRPGTLPGELHLDVEVIEARRYGGSLEVNNYQAPAIGAVNARMGIQYANLTGWGDELSVNAGFSAGVVDVDSQYRAPLNRHDTRLDLRFRYTTTKIVDPILSGVDIENRYIAGGVSLAQPLYRTPNTHFEMGLLGEWRQSRSYFDGFRFDFSDAAEKGQVRTSVLRLFQDFVHQGRSQVFAARSTWSFGLNALGATSGPVETSSFVAWLGQVQWIRRFEPSGMELFARGYVQLALDPLVPFERFSVGGRYSVRGYRQNQLVSDSGYTLSFEARYPLLRAPNGRSTLQIVPFIDVGRGWFRGRGGEPPGESLAGAGIGLVWRPTDWCYAELFYGSDIWDVAETGSRDLQDHGISFRLSVMSF